MLREATHILVDARNCIISLVSTMGTGVQQCLHTGSQGSSKQEVQRLHSLSATIFFHVVDFCSSLPPHHHRCQIKVNAATAASTLSLHRVAKITDGVFWKVQHNSRKCTQYSTTARSTAVVLIQTAFFVWFFLE